MSNLFETPAWQLFNARFKDGENVVVVDDDDKFYFGKLRIKIMGCTLIRPEGEEKHLLWEDVRFIAHDGFPVKKLLGADGSELIEAMDTRSIQKKVRLALTHEYCSKCKKHFLTEDTVFHPGHLGRGIHYECTKCHIVFGDPYEIEPVRAQLFFPGNNLNDVNDHRRFWPWEEVIAMEADDGAKALLWNVTTIYHFG